MYIYPLPSNALTDNTWIKYCDRKLLIYTKEVPETQELDVYPTFQLIFPSALNYTSGVGQFLYSLLYDISSFSSSSVSCMLWIGVYFPS